MRPLDIFDKKEVAAIGRCIALCLEDDVIFPNWEFQILTGATLQEARETLKNWPDVELGTEEVWLTVHGVLANMDGYPHGKETVILSETGLETDDIKRLYEKLPDLTDSI